jgi:hypothetical protein
MKQHAKDFDSAVRTKLLDLLQDEEGAADK